MANVTFARVVVPCSLGACRTQTVVLKGREMSSVVKIHAGVPCTMSLDSVIGTGVVRRRSQ